MAGEFGLQRGDRGRRGAAAAADDRDAGSEVVPHGRGEIIGAEVVAAVRVGQAGVRLDKDRHPGRHNPAEPFGKGQDFGRAERAVDADRVRPETDRRDAEALDRAAGEGAAAGLKTHRGEHRQRAVFLGGEQCGLELIEVGHRLDDDEVGPGRSTCPHNGGKPGNGFLKPERAGRGEQLAQRADIKRDQRAGLGRGRSGAGDRGGDRLGHRVAGIGELVLVGAEGVGQQDVSAGAGVVPVDGGQGFGHCEGRKLGQRAGRKAPLLQLGAHAAVQQYKMAAVKQFLKFHRSSLSSDRRRFRAAGSGRSRPAHR